MFTSQKKWTANGNVESLTMTINFRYFQQNLPEFKKPSSASYAYVSMQYFRDEHSKFACDFVQACAQAAKDAGVSFFATHFWGECWEVNITEGAAVANGDGCSLADGLYKSKCAGTDLSNECLGTTNYYVYSISVPRG